MANHALCPVCEDYITPLDTIEGICSRCFVEKENDDSMD